MKKTLYLHIGTPKTGTSTIQHFLKENAIRLMINGIYYPEFNLSQAWGGKDSIDGNFGWFTRVDLPIDRKIEKIVQCFEKSNKVLLSSENVWFEIKDKPEFLRLLNKHGIEVKVIVYLRKQVDYLESQYRECIRLILSSEPVELACNPESGILGGVYGYLDYYSVLEDMAQVIGRENIIVHPYERTQFVNNDIIEDFMSIFKVSLTSEWHMPSKQYNPSMNNNALWIKRYMNQSFKAQQNKLNSIFYDILLADGTVKQGEKVKSLIPYNTRCEMMKQYWECNKMVAERYLHRDNGILFVENISEESEEEFDGEKVLGTFVKVFTSSIIDIYSKMNDVEKKSIQLQQKTDILQPQLDKIQQKIDILQRQLNDKQIEIDTLLNSRSWRITAPLRWIMSLTRKMKEH